MVLPMDYHVHTRFSADSLLAPEEVCSRAIEVGIREICFTDHYESNPVSRAERTLDPQEYLAEIERCRQIFQDQLVIKAGLEIGEPHLYQTGLQELVANHRFDYLLGSIHWLGDELIGPEYLSKREFSRACCEYLELVHETAKFGPYHCLGHLDMVKRHATPYYQRSFLYSEYREEIEVILQTLIEHGRGLEVNCSGWRQGIGEPYPGLEVLKRYRELGGEIITLGSDSHRLLQVGMNLEKGLAVIKAAGFRALTLYTDGKPFWKDI